jgi:hypothetical protein
MRATVPTTYNIYLVLVSRTVLENMPWSFVGLMDDACWAKSGGAVGRAASVESAEDGIKCQADRVQRAAMRLQWCILLHVLVTNEWMYGYRLWFWTFLYTGPPLLHPLCHWLVSRVGRRGLLNVVWGGKGHFCMIFGCSPQYKTVTPIHVHFNLCINIFRITWLNDSSLFRYEHELYS